MEVCLKVEKCSGRVVSIIFGSIHQCGACSASKSALCLLAMLALFRCVKVEVFRGKAVVVGPSHEVSISLWR